MRIVSLNAWGGAMYDALAEWLPACGADVLCLQEITRTPGVSGWTTFTDGERELPQRADLFDDVRRLLPDHQRRSWRATPARSSTVTGAPTGRSSGSPHSSRRTSR